MDAININDVYQPYVTNQVAGGEQGMVPIDAASTYGSGASQASPIGISMTWGMIGTLFVIAYLILR